MAAVHKEAQEDRLQKLGEHLDKIKNGMSELIESRPITAVCNGPRPTGAVRPVCRLLLCPLR